MGTKYSNIIKKYIPGYMNSVILTITTENTLSQVEYHSLKQKKCLKLHTNNGSLSGKCTTVPTDLHCKSISLFWGNRKRCEFDLQCSIHFSLVFPLSRIVWSVFSVFFPLFPDRQWNSNQEKTGSERENYKSLRTD